jgi:hypothetical protein
VPADRPKQVRIWVNRERHHPGGRLGPVGRETNEDATDRDTLIRDLVLGEYSKPVRIVAFNPAEDGPAM